MRRTLVMNDLLRATLLFFTTHLRRSFAARRTLFLLAFALLPGAVAWCLARFAQRIAASDIATHIGWLLFLQIVLPSVALVGGTAVIAEEVEDRTISYLFSRPIHRASLLLGRWLATLVVLSILLSIGAAFLVWCATQPAVEGVISTRHGLGPPASRLLDEGIALPLLQAGLLGVLVYSALFSISGVLFKHPMIVGVGYAFVIEGFLANLPGKNQALTIQYYLRSWIAASGSDAWSRVEGFAGAGFDAPRNVITTLVAISLGALALGAWRLSRREFVLTS
jgi:ABC-type transport system involved in multi-copper enzyme maturation permease subunit